MPYYSRTLLLPLSAVLILLATAPRVVTQSATFGITDLGGFVTPRAVAHSGDPVGFPYYVGARGDGGRVLAVEGLPGVTPRDLGTLGGTNSRALALSAGGDIAFESQTATHDCHAFANGMQDLGTLGGTNSTATAINQDGTIVGRSLNSAGRKKAVMWRNGAIVDLNTVIPQGRGHGFILTPPIELACRRCASRSARTA